MEWAKIFGASTNSQRKMKDDNPEIASVLSAKLLDIGLALLEKNPKKSLTAPSKKKAMRRSRI